MAGGTEPGVTVTAPSALESGHTGEKGYSKAGDGVLDRSTTNRSTSYEDEPTAEELQTLRRVADRLPNSAWLVAIIELCEGFAYYGLSGPFQNYIENPRNDPKLPGAIGKTFAMMISILVALSLTAIQASGRLVRLA